MGLGIHGEPGVPDPHMPTLRTGRTTPGAAPRRATGRGGPPRRRNRQRLGTVKYEELFLLWGHVQTPWPGPGSRWCRPEVGELVTSLDMAACSLTLMWLDEDLERWWCSRADTPGFSRLPLPKAPDGPGAPSPKR